MAAQSAVGGVKLTLLGQTQRHDALCHRTTIRQHFPRSDPHNLDSLIGYKRVAAYVPRGTITHIVRNPVNLEPKLGGCAIEVEHKWPNRVLSPDLHSALPSSKFAPEQTFR